MHHRTASYDGRYRTIVCVPIGIVSDGQPDYYEPYCIQRKQFLSVNPLMRTVQDLHTYGDLSPRYGNYTNPVVTVEGVKVKSYTPKPS